MRFFSSSRVQCTPSLDILLRMSWNPGQASQSGRLKGTSEKNFIAQPPGSVKPKIELDLRAVGLTIAPLRSSRSGSAKNRSREQVNRLKIGKI